MENEDKWKFGMVVTTAYHPILSLVAGIMIFIIPKLLNDIVAIYLIVAVIVGMIR